MLLDTREPVCSARFGADGFRASDLHLGSLASPAGLLPLTRTFLDPSSLTLGRFLRLPSSHCLFSLTKRSINLSRFRLLFATGRTEPFESVLEPTRWFGNVALFNEDFYSARGALNDIPDNP